MVAPSIPFCGAGVLRGGKSWSSGKDQAPPPVVAPLPDGLPPYPQRPPHSATGLVGGHPWLWLVSSAVDLANTRHGQLLCHSGSVLWRASLPGRERSKNRAQFQVSNPDCLFTNPLPLGAAPNRPEGSNGRASSIVWDWEPPPGKELWAWSTWLSGFARPILWLNTQWPPK